MLTMGQIQNPADSQLTHRQRSTCNLRIVHIMFSLLDVYSNCNICLPEMEKPDEVSLIIKVSSGICGCVCASWLICWLTYRSSRMNLFPLSPRTPRVLGFHKAARVLQHLFMLFGSLCSHEAIHHVSFICRQKSLR